MTDEKTPRRIQLLRLPPNTVKIARPGKWGNRFRVLHAPSGKWVVIDEKNFFYSDATTRREAATIAVELFELDLRGDPVRVAECRAELRGKNLACFCEIGESCHGDVLLKIANEGDAK